ncbi:MAG TPA: hypothetical protein VHR45_21845 [Thermoanaerobaculia bacterium]|nr:hypothetical protein [Thermoanaerobaculia bacterium]
MTATGHATPQESERIAALEAKLGRKTISCDEHLELALLQLEPCHDGFRAAELLEEIIAAKPDHSLAKIWLAHCWIYEWMDEEALRNAVRLCNTLLDERVSVHLRSAALLLKASALRQLPDSDDPLALLLESVRLAPDWISNREMLAQVYQERGDRNAAAEQLRRALEVSRAPHQVSSSYAEQMFKKRIARRGGGRLTFKDLENRIRSLGTPE